MTPAPKLVVLCCTLSVLLGACGLPIGRESVLGGGGSIVVGLSQIGSLDPPRATGTAAMAVLRTACDGLVGLDPGSGTPRPALAESWDLHEGARRLTLRLRPGLKFSDGSAVTAAAVREALSRVARPSTSSPWTNLVSKIAGFAEVQSGTATNLSGVKPLEDLGLEIELSEPYSDFPTVLSHPSLVPVSLDSLDENPDGPDEPVCAGPYRIEQGLEPGDLRLSRTTTGAGHNEAYLRKGAGFAERILIRSFESREDAYQAYRAGAVDVAPVPDSRLGEAQASGAGFVSIATPQITYLAFDPANPVTADPRFRQAVSLAIDRLAIIDAAYGDQRQPATRWLPGAYGRGAESTCAGYARRIADPPRARDLLEASGVQPEGLSIALFYDPAMTGRLVAEAIQIQVREVLGISLQPRELDGEDVVSSFNSRGSAAAAWIMATDIDLPLPDQFLGDLYRTGSAKNILGFSDRTFDARTEDARKATSGEDIQRFYVQAENALCNQMPAIPLWTSVSHWMINPDKVEFAGEHKLNSLGGPLLRHLSAVRD